jgi:hypothetical protein
LETVDIWLDRLKKGTSPMNPKEPSPSKPNRPADEFQKQAEQAQPGLISEFIDFVLHNKKWWLIPIIVMLLVLGLLAVLGGSGMAPFIYTLF